MVTKLQMVASLTYQIISCVASLVSCLLAFLLTWYLAY